MMFEQGPGTREGMKPLEEGYPTQGTEIKKETTGPKALRLGKASLIIQLSRFQEFMRMQFSLRTQRDGRERENGLAMSLWQPGCNSSRLHVPICALWLLVFSWQLHSCFLPFSNQWLGSLTMWAQSPVPLI